ncbi:LuxR C-terminal-related transcriptional regulator [Hydrogenophaga sp. SL48]|jgi:DNA-binding NarL/FixJ family response regulator|uniref:LuxR C-terminal-related transcriptional regulator n=1 Tax=Hydrogenophaga sp. SL48 TaxID=2806347 RepID=UPI001F1D893F|nr:response regulator transcription factor [Hydrogenophaga sp. SL48]UJW82351.1 response regulator transcription factor [Hydrogenophaga sp. SL48]
MSVLPEPHELPATDGATRIYLIEDDPSIVQFVQRALVSRPSWRLVGHSGSVDHARQHALAGRANVFLVDLGLPDGRGEELLRWLAHERPDAELLVFTVFGGESSLVAALQAGATGYVLKGCRSDELIAAIEQIRDGGAPISPLLARMLLKQFRVAPDAPAPSLVLHDVLLSERETEVLRLVAQGYVNKEIAQRLTISPATVGSHIKNLYRKLAVHSRVQVVRVAQKRGLL